MGKTYLWILQLITGVLIAIFLGIHVVLLHLNDILGTTEPTSWVTMIGRSSQGIFVALYIALLAVGLYHGINGLRNLLLEVTKSAKTVRIVNWVFAVLGICIFVWGAYVPVALLSG